MADEKLPVEAEKNTKDFQVLEKKIAKVQGAIEKKMGELSEYVDRRLACLEGRIGDFLEEAGEPSCRDALASSSPQAPPSWTMPSSI